MSDNQAITKKQKRELKKEEQKQERQSQINTQKKKKYTFTIIVAALIAFMIWGIMQISQQGAPESNDPFEISEADHVLGNADAPITLIEYSDFECPFCAKTQPILKQLLATYPDDLKIVYRNFPLTSIHKTALPAAQIAEAAGMQGRFWEMHDLIFENSNAWTNDIDPIAKILSFAELAGVDQGQLKKDMKSRTVSRKINTDRRFAAQLNVRSTPSFFLNGERIETPSNLESFKSLIEPLLQKQNETIEITEEQEQINE